MARNLYLLRRFQLGVGLHEQAVRFFTNAGDLVAHADAALGHGRLHTGQFGQFGFQFDQRLFKVEMIGHVSASCKSEGVFQGRETPGHVPATGVAQFARNSKQRCLSVCSNQKERHLAMTLFLSGDSRQTLNGAGFCQRVLVGYSL